MAAHSATAHRIEFPAPDFITLYARPAEWPGIARAFAPRRRYLARWTHIAPERSVDPWTRADNDISILALIEADMQVLFGEVWDLLRAYPRVAATCLGLVTGYTLWA